MTGEDVEETHRSDDSAIGQSLLARYELVSEHLREDDAPPSPVQNTSCHNGDTDQAIPIGGYKVTVGIRNTEV